MQKFATRGFDGVPRQHLLVEHQDLKPATQIDPTPSHHIVIVDASGSMWGDMTSMKATIEKVLTLQEFQDANQYVSLLSYSSKGDVMPHFTHVKVSDVNAPGSRYLQEIRNLRVRGLTCISQALNAAKGLCQLGETTCITLHSDGYANDRSPSTERREIAKEIGDLAKLPGVFCNTIAHRGYCDFNLLSSLANSLNGKSIQARDIREVYNALQDTTALLAGQRVSSVKIPIGKADYQVFSSSSDQRVIGTTKDLTVPGLSSGGRKEVYQFTEVSKEVYDSTDVEEASCVPMYAYIVGSLAEGSLNTAKYALVSTRDKFLLERHSRALTGAEIAAFKQEVTGVLLNNYAREYNSEYALDSSITPVLPILEVLSKWAGDLSLNTKSLTKNYTRRTLSRIAGVRKDGELTLPWVAEKIEDSDFAQISSVSISHNTANATIKVHRKLGLVVRESGEEIKEVMGVDLSNLRSYRSYTVVGDGSVHTPQLEIRIADKRAFADLKRVGAVNGSFFPLTTYVIDLSDRPIVSYSQSFDPKDLDGVVETLSKYRVLGSILTALTATSSEKYTWDQVQELKRHYLSPALYLSLPTTTAHEDLGEAISSGKVDSRVSYKITLGNEKILSVSKFKSANAYLQRRFVVHDDEGDIVKKPTWEMWRESPNVEVKALSARTKLDAADDIAMPIMSSFWGYPSYRGPVVLDILEEANFTEEQLKRMGGVLRRPESLSDEDIITIFTEALHAVKKAEALLYSTYVSPLAFYVGSTGLIPDEFKATALTAEELLKKVPLKLSKSEKEGTFFRVGSHVISVYTENVYFTT